MIVQPYASVTLIVVLATAPLVAHAQAVPQAGAAVETTQASPDSLLRLGAGGGLDRIAFGRYVDEVVEAQLRAFHLPGAAVAVVRRGEVLHSRGYGYADVAAGRRFDSRTVFRTASVSKLFTSVAVMQLVEQGLIDLDADVSTYVDITVPSAFPTPVTMRHLLTHTAGFDDRVLGTSASRHRLEDVVRVRDFLTSRDAAPQVRPPGMLISYSNHGMALAGYVVERISGKSFEDYIDERIHRPLGMTRSTFHEAIPAELAADRARAYLHRRGLHEALPITFENAGPAGSQYSTADDIARFLLMNLGGGSLDGARVLEPGTLRQMHATAFTHHPLLPGWTLGFTEYHWEGYRLVGHGGDLPGYHNQLILLPDAGVGVFVHFNGIWPVDLDDDPRMRVVEAVLTALVPVEGHRTRFPEPAGGAILKPVSAGFAVLGATPAGSPSVAGNYRLTRHAVTSMEKLLLPNSLLRLHVREYDDGSLRVTMPAGFVGQSEWVPVGPVLYQRAGGTDYLAFGTDQRGRATHLYGTFMIPLAFERVLWYESEIVLLGLLAFVVITFIGVSVGWISRSAVRRIRRIPTQARTPGQRQRIMLARTAAGLGALVLVSLGLMVAQVATVGDASLIGIRPLLAVMAVACGLVSLWLGYLTTRSWRDGDGPASERLVHAVVALAGVLFLWQMSYWNVLG
jgi:CubicO group peptidase (beta-lactamase class C family)